MSHDGAEALVRGRWLQRLAFHRGAGRPPAERAAIIPTLIRQALDPHRKAIRWAIRRFHDLTAVRRPRGAGFKG